MKKFRFVCRLAIHTLRRLTFKALLEKIKGPVQVPFNVMANGAFDDNSFLLLPSEPRSVRFLPFDSFDAALLARSLRVEHLAENQGLEV